MEKIDEQGRLRDMQKVWELVGEGKRKDLEERGNRQRWHW